MVFANQEGRFLISFSNFGGRTFSHLLILTFGSGGVGVIGIPGHFRTQFPLSASGKSVVGLLLRCWLSLFEKNVPNHFKTESKVHCYFSFRLNESPDYYTAL